MYENSLVQLLVGAPPDYSKFDNDFKCKSDINFFFFFFFSFFSFLAINL